MKLGHFIGVGLMQITSRVFLTLSLCMGATSPAFAAAPSFQGLGDLTGGAFSSSAYGVSTDGSVVVGESNSASGDEAFRWTLAGGMQPLGDLSGGAFSSVAANVSGDGSVVVGIGTSASGVEAVRWVGAAPAQGLGDLPGGDFSSYAVDVDHTGTTIAGFSDSTPGIQAFRWTSADGLQGLGDLEGDDFFSMAGAISDDGTTIVGFGTPERDFELGRGPEAFRWTSGGGMQQLGDLPGGSFLSFAQAVSSDGSTVVGHGTTAAGYEAFRWTSAGGMQGLGDLSGFGSGGIDVSGDGSIVVGISETADEMVNEAFIWDEVHGIRDLREVLITDYGLDLAGWSLQKAIAISSDGSTIVGVGLNPLNQTEAWIATVPEPTTLPLIGLAALALRRRKLRYTMMESRPSASR
jgi:probable HAF family extracellular repeat protein